MDYQPYGLHKEEKTYGMLCHLLSLSGLLIPFGSIIGPLVIWLIKKDQSQYVNMHGKESLNFQISVTIYSIVSAILMLIFIGFILAIGVFIFWLVFTIIASIRASEGSSYKYPLTIRFIK